MFQPTGTTPHPSPGARRLALWGGIECTVNRVGDAWQDQYERSGHAERIDDLDRIADLGIRTLRYGLPWERIAPNGLDRADWAWPDARLARLRERGIRPIAGLVHHGSGPAGTDLLDPGFPEKLAAFARALAERYPWLDAWTPVNEPFTTARFSALYGHWYPHLRDERACMTALLTECTAVALAMAQVRAVNPAAELIQTEDLGKTHGTDRTRLQVEFENERRWITFDLLMGRVVPGHWMWEHLRWLGIPERDVAFFAEHPCPPDVLGINTYVTSERFLDHRLELYPPHLHGGNGPLAYADVEAVRVRRAGIDGPAGLLREAWERYRRPLAITEAHLGCSREDQVRWLAEVWGDADEAREAGADVRAVTVWSLLGAHDWHCLLTRREGHYEPGAFDLRAPVPRPTAVAKLASRLARGATPDHPLLADPGWWRRPERLLYPPWPESDADVTDDESRRVRSAPPARVDRTSSRVAAEIAAGVGHAAARAAIAAGDGDAERGEWRGSARRFGIAPRPLLLVGVDGALGQEVAAACAGRGIRCAALAAGTAESAAAADIAADLVALRPWAVVDARLRRGEGEAASDPNGWMPAAIATAAALAEACAVLDLPLLAFSSDLVFDGRAGVSHVESDPVAPRGPVGRGHAEIEARVAARSPGALVARTGMPLANDVRDPFLAAALAALARGEAVVADDTIPRSLAVLPDLADAALDLLVDGETGVWHLAHPGPLTRAALLRALAERLGHDPALVRPAPSGGPGAGTVPGALDRGGSVLGSERGVLLPPAASALERLAAA